MSDVKWIKIVTNIFDNRKIKQIEIMPDGDTILIIWFKLICLAGSINDNGMVYLTTEIPYTEEMLAAQFGRPLTVVRLALRTFESFGMIEVVDNFLCLPSWGKYQSADKLERMKSKNAERQARFREKKRAEMLGSNVTQALPVTQSNAIEEDIDIDRDIEGDIEEREIVTAAEPPAPPRTHVPYETIKNLYNEICTAFPQCTAMSDARKKAIKARFAGGYTIDHFRTLFEKAQASSFLKGANDRNWMATFDWLIKDSNMAKVLGGNFDDRGQSHMARSRNVPPSGVDRLLEKIERGDFDE